MESAAPAAGRMLLAVLASVLGCAVASAGTAGAAVPRQDRADAHDRALIDALIRQGTVLLDERPRTAQQLYAYLAPRTTGCAAAVRKAFISYTKVYYDLNMLVNMQIGAAHRNQYRRYWTTVAALHPHAPEFAAWVAEVKAANPATFHALDAFLPRHPDYCAAVRYADQEPNLWQNALVVAGVDKRFFKMPPGRTAGPFRDFLIRSGYTDKDGAALQIE